METINLNLSKLHFEIINYAGSNAILMPTELMNTSSCVDQLRSLAHWPRTSFFYSFASCLGQIFYAGETRYRLYSTETQSFRMNSATRFTASASSKRINHLFWLFQMGKCFQFLIYRCIHQQSNVVCLQRVFSIFLSCTPVWQINSPFFIWG